MSFEFELYEAARQILEGKKPEKKDKPKSDDIEIDVKTKDGKVTKLHTSDADGDGVVADGTKDEKKVSAPKKKDGDKDGKIDDGKETEAKDDSKDEPDGKDAKPKSKSAQSDGSPKDSGQDGDSSDDQASKTKKASSPVKDDSADDGAEEKEVSNDEAETSNKEAGNFGKKDDGADSKQSDDDSEDEGLPLEGEDDEEESEEGDDGKSKQEKEDEVTGSEKTKVDLNPKLKDEVPGEMPVSETTVALRNELEKLKQVAEKYEGAYVGNAARIMYRAREKAINELSVRLADSELNDIIEYFDTPHGFAVIREGIEGQSVPGEFFIDTKTMTMEALVMFPEGVETVKLDISNVFERVMIKYDDSSGKGTASMNVKVSAKNKEHAKKKALDSLKKYPHPMSGYKNARVQRVTEGQTSAGHQKGNAAKKSANEHWAHTSHHEELAAHHENQEDYDTAAKHDRASQLHSQAADWYESAHRSHKHGQDPDKAEYQHSKADAFARQAHNHKIMAGI